MGKLIVFEGTDGTGKSTQFSLLTQRLSGERREFQTLRFPQYEKPSSALIRMYLDGEFGTNPSDVNAYAASTFYAVDRYASYQTVWGEYYRSGGILLSDRYTTSNAVHQASKVSEVERPDFLRWLYDLEHEKMGLPKPDLVLWMDMPIALTLELMQSRQKNTDTKADIHELDGAYLRQCYQMAREAADHYGWTVISCVKNGAIRSIEEIHDEIYAYVTACLEA